VEKGTQSLNQSVLGDKSSPILSARTPRFSFSVCFFKTGQNLVLLQTAMQVMNNDLKGTQKQGAENSVDLILKQLQA
jgi:hypothetical protein